LAIVFAKNYRYCTVIVSCLKGLVFEMRYGCYAPFIKQLFALVRPFNRIVKIHAQ